MADTNLRLIQATGVLLFDALTLLGDTITPSWWALDEATTKAYREQIAVLWKLILGLLPGAFTEDMRALNNAVIAVTNSEVGVLASEVATDWHKLLDEILVAYRSDLKANASIDPTKVNDIVGAALARASYLGLGSRAITALFEIFIPKQLNFMNWLGPVLAQFSGYEEIVSLSRAPQYKHAFGNLAEYDAAQTFRTTAPSHRDAEQMFARRLITQPELTKLIGWSGLMTEFQDPMLATAYRPVPPFLLARAAEAGFVPADALTAALQFGGFRDADITALESAYAELALQPYRTSALSAYKRAFELGTRSASDFADDLDYLKVPTDAQVIIQVECAGRKLEQLAELYRKSISEAYKYGQISDAQYVPALEGIGIGAADAQAHYAIDSIAKTGKAMAAELKAEEKLAMQRQRAGIAAAIAQFRAGDPGEAELLAKLLALGVDPAIAGFIVSAQSARVAGSMIYLYGVELTRAAALVLRENVMALEEQYKKQLIDDAQAAAGMSALGIPERNATPLLAQWAAGKMKLTTTGERLPR